MDLNFEYAAHQKALMLAEQATSDAGREAHLADAFRIADRINTFQLKLGAAAACTWTMSNLAVPKIDE